MTPVVHSGLVAAALLMATHDTASAADTGAPPKYPSKPIRVLVGSPPGSPPDVVARVVGERLATELAQPVVVENRPGAIGTIAMHAVSKATPDGYTFGVLSMPYVIAPALVAQLPYDTVRDLAAVSQVVWASHVLVVRASSPWKSVSELVAAAKSRPGQITFASGGNATPAHLAGEFLRLRTGADIRHVPFKGAVAGISAVLGEQIDIMFAAATASAPYVKTGKLRALATPAPDRIPALPDIPTMVELGYVGFEIREWHGVVAPAKTPSHITTRMSAEIAKVTSNAQAKERLVANGMDTTVQAGPEAFAMLIRSELTRWAGIVREAGIRVD